MKTLKNRVWGMTFILTMAMTMVYSFAPLETNASDNPTYAAGYCWNSNGDVWVACNFPNGPCNKPIWCSAGDPSQ